MRSESSDSNIGTCEIFESSAQSIVLCKETIGGVKFAFKVEFGS